MKFFGKCEWKISYDIRQDELVMFLCSEHILIATAPLRYSNLFYK